MNDDVLLITGIVAGVLALALLLLRPRRQPPLRIGAPMPRPRPILPVRHSSLVQRIDEAFDALEIKPVRLPSIEIVIDEPPPRRAAHSMFDTSDSPREATQFPVEPTSYEAAAFGAEPTVTVVDDDDGMNAVDELAAFLAREERAARAATWIGVPYGRADTARTPPN